MNYGMFVGIWLVIGYVSAGEPNKISRKFATTAEFSQRTRQAGSPGGLGPPGREDSRPRALSLRRAFLRRRRSISASLWDVEGDIFLAAITGLTL